MRVLLSPSERNVKKNLARTQGKRPSAVLSAASEDKEGVKNDETEKKKKKLR